MRKKYNESNRNHLMIPEHVGINYCKMQLCHLLILQHSVCNLVMIVMIGII